MNFKQYLAFGETTLDTLGVTKQGYIGKEKDVENNLGDNGVRKYDYETGRFNSPDVLWEKYYGWSPYQYCMNNPIWAKDWDGREIWATNEESRTLIIKSIEQKYQPLISFSNDGLLNTSKISNLGHESNAGKLHFLNSLNDKIIVKAQEKHDVFVSKYYDGEQIQTKSSTLGELSTNGVARMAIQNDNNGNLLFNTGVMMSNRKDSYIFVRKDLVDIKSFSTLAHELFYHTYLYFNKNHKSHKSWFTDPGIKFEEGFKYDSKLDKKVRENANK